MFPNKGTTEAQVDSIRKKWKDYKISPDTRKRCLELIRPFAQSIFALIDLSRPSNPKKADSDKEEFTKLAGLFSRDCFLVGMEYSSPDIIEDVRGFLMIVSDQLIRFIVQRISECVELGATPKEDRDGIVRTNLEHIAQLSKECFEIGVSYNPRRVAILQESSQATLNSSNVQQDKIRYYYAHVYLPRMFFELSQKMYENLASENGNDFLLYLWGKVANNLSSKTPSSGLKLYKEKLDSSHETFVIHMPRPQVVPEAFWGAVVFELDYFTIVPKIISVRYFTLELGRNPYAPSDEYYFCEWSTLKEHLNYGKIAQNDMKLFIQAISSTIKS